MTVTSRLKLALLALMSSILFASSAEAQVIEELACAYDPDTGLVEATWVNPEVLDIITVTENGVLVQELFGNAESASLTPPVGATTVEYCFEAAQSGTEVCCTVLLPPPPVTELFCPIEFQDDPAAPVALDLTWSNGSDEYTDIDVFLCGELVETLAGDATGTKVSVEPGTQASVSVHGRRGSLASDASRCSRYVLPPPRPPLNLDCQVVPGTTTVNVSWVNAAPYDQFCVFIDGEFETLLDETRTAYTTGPLADGTTTICIQAKVDELVVESCCEVTILSVACPNSKADAGKALNPGIVEVEWTLPPVEIELIQLYRDGDVILETADPTVVSFVDDAADASGRPVVTYHIGTTCVDGGTSISEGLSVVLPTLAAESFVRGDCNNDGYQDIGDLIRLLVYLYLDATQPLPCPDACDFTNDGSLELVDVLGQIDFYFRGGAGPGDPYPECGVDDDGSLGCPSYDQCTEPPVQWDHGWTINPQLDLADGGERPPFPTGGGGGMTQIDPPSLQVDAGPATPTSSTRSLRMDVSMVALENSRGHAPRGSGVINATGELVLRPRFDVGLLPGLLPFNYLDMTYSSKIDFQSCVGNGWNLWPITDRVTVLPDGTIRRFDSRLARVDDYDPQTGQATGHFDCVDDDCNGTDDDDGIRFRSPNGTVTTYDCATGLLRQVRDPHGNTIDVAIDDDGIVRSLTDAHGRTIRYEYDDFGRVASIVDFANRETVFEYDDSNHLIAVTLPEITGTPNEDDGIIANGFAGNDFPDGKVFRFRYDTTNPDPNLRDNLLGVTYPNEVATGGPERHRFQYGTIFGDPDFDRCVSIQSGSVSSPALVEGDPSPPSSRRAIQLETLPHDDFERFVRVTDPNGNVREYGFDEFLRCVQVDVPTQRGVNPLDPPLFTTTYEYDEEHRVVAITSPTGRLVEYTYDQSSPNRGSQANCLEVRVTPDAARGGDQDVLVTSYTYEPIYNNIRTMTSPRGNDTSYDPEIPDTDLIPEIDLNLDGDGDDPDDGETLRRRRYTSVYTYDYQEGTEEDIATLAQSAGINLDLDGDGLADVSLALDSDENGDGSTSQQGGSCIKVWFPWLQTDSDGVAVVEQVTTTHTYNEFGQRTSSADPEGNLRSYYYNPVGTPHEPGPPSQQLSNFGGGYLRMVVSDDDPDAASDPSADEERPIAQAVENEGTSRRVRLAEFAQVRVTTEYDTVGNVTASTDGRGTTTTFVVNAHNQTVRMNKAELVESASGLSARGYVTDYAYDYNGNVIRVSEEDRGDTSRCGGDNGSIAFVDEERRYDALDRLVSVEKEIIHEEFGQVRTQDRQYRYDPVGNLVLEIAPAGNATSYVFDDRNLLFTKTVGALVIPPLVQLGSGDPIRFIARGGIPARSSYLADGAGQVLETTDAEDSDNSPANNSALGHGDRTRYQYDGFHRLVSVIDPAGNQTVYQYDPDGNPVSESLFGSIGGVTPGSNGAAVLDEPVSSAGTIQLGNLVSVELLAREERVFDEFRRVSRSDQVLFHNSTAVVRELDLADGGVEVGKSNPLDGDDGPIAGVDTVTVFGRVNSQVQFDRNGCVVSRTNDSGDVTTYELDGLDRVVLVTDSAGNTTEYAYDPNDNCVETRCTHISSDGSIGDRVLLLTNEYDCLDRCIRETDNLGRSVYYRYDSRDNLVCEADAEGPDGEVIARLLEEGDETVNLTNDPGNVTLHFYDGLGRRVRSEQILTADGTGDGSLGCDDDGVKDPSAGPVADTNQGGGDGIIRTGLVYDQNSQVVALLDDQGNVSIALYDNQDRCIAEANGLSVDSILTSTRVLGERSIPVLSPKTLQAPLFLPRSLVDAQLGDIEEQLSELTLLFPQLADRVDSPTSRIYGFDGDGDLRLHLDENGSEWHNFFDALHRCVAKRCYREGQSDTPPPVAGYDTWPALYEFDAGSALVGGTNAQDFEYDGVGRVTYSADYLDDDSDDDSILCSFSYDSLGNCVEESRSIGAGDPQVCSSGWRGGDQRSSLTYPDGRVIRYEYDELLRFKVVSEEVGGATTELGSFEYLGTSIVSSRSHGNLTVSNIGSSGKDGVELDAGLQVTGIEHLDASSSQLLGFQYQLNRRGLRIHQEKTHDSTNSEDWGFDSMARVTSFERVGAGAQSPLHSSWVLDGVGNWSTVDSEARDHSNFNELISQSSGDGTSTDTSHDENGNLTVSNIGSSGEDGVRSYHYDPFDRLVLVTEDGADGVATVVEYRYDAHHRRTIKRMGTSEVLYCWDGFRVLEEHDESDVLVAQYCWVGAGAPLCYDRFDPAGGRSTYYCHTDAAGSCYGLSDADGSLVEAYMYDAYGRPTVVTDESGGSIDFSDTTLYGVGESSGLGYPYLFQGMRYDDETGLYHDRSDYLSSHRGRSLTRDAGSSYRMPTLVADIGPSARVVNGTVGGDLDVRNSQSARIDNGTVMGDLDIQTERHVYPILPHDPAPPLEPLPEIDPCPLRTAPGGGIGGGTGSGMGSSAQRGWDGTYKGKPIKTSARSASRPDVFFDVFTELSSVRSPNDHDDDCSGGDTARGRRRRAAKVINLQTPLGLARIVESGFHVGSGGSHGARLDPRNTRKNRRPQLFSTAARVGRVGRNPQTGATLQGRAVRFAIREGGRTVGAGKDADIIK